MNNQNDSNISNPLDSIDNNLLEIIKRIDEEEYCAGLVPLDLLTSKAKINLNLTTKQLHKRLHILETLNIIYFESINDPSRLTGSQLNYSINDKKRGILFYVGRL